MLANAEATAQDPLGFSPANTFNFTDDPTAQSLKITKEGIQLNGKSYLSEQVINLAPDVNIARSSDGTIILYKQGETTELALGDEITKTSDDVLKIKTGGKTFEIKMPVGFNSNKFSRTGLAGHERATPSLEEQKQEAEQQGAINGLNKSNTGSIANPD